MALITIVVQEKCMCQLRRFTMAHALM